MKAQLLQVGTQHAQALKDAAAFGEAKVEEAKKHLLLPAARRPEI